MAGDFSVWLGFISVPCGITGSEGQTLKDLCAGWTLWWLATLYSVIRRSTGAMDHVCCPCETSHRQHGSPAGWWLGSHRKHAAWGSRSIRHEQLEPQKSYWYCAVGGSSVSSVGSRERAVYLVSWTENHRAWRMEDAVVVFGYNITYTWFAQTHHMMYIIWIQLSLIEVGVNGKNTILGIHYSYSLRQYTLNCVLFQKRGER